MDTIHLVMDGKELQAKPNDTILQVAEKAGIKIPTLCHHPDQSIKASCRVCVVEVEGQRVLQPACAFPVYEGMKIKTASPSVLEARRTILELMLAHHPQDCLHCERNLSCELQTLAHAFGVSETRFPKNFRDLPIDEASNAVVRDPGKCINCGRCVESCNEVQTVSILSHTNRGYHSVVSTAYDKSLSEVACVLCGQCIQACPVGALKEKSHIDEVWEALADPSVHVVVQTAPAVRVGLGEELGLPVGTRVTKKMVAALRRLGFDRVFDTDFTADLTIMEEGHELLHRLQTKGQLPMITSCSPGWIKFIEHFYPELLGHLSTCKSPQQMFGALVKTYYAEKEGIDPKKIFSVSIMPCTAKKFEAHRPEMRDSGCQDVDVVLTTRELGRMIKQAGMDFGSLPEEEFDSPMGISSGAGAIFGATGGVMEAALRTVFEVVTKQELPKLEFEMVRGLEGIKTATVSLPLPDSGETLDVKVAVAHGLGKAREIMELVAQKKADFHFIEIMSCPGGCVGGGGQPRPTTNEKRQERGLAIYEEDSSMTLRKSHENEAVQTLYKEFLGEPLGDKSHHLLHTHYTKRAPF